MKIKIRGNSTFPVPYIYVDGIAIPVGAWMDLEVLDGDENPPPVVNEMKNADGIAIKVKRPNQEVIGRLTYQHMIDDGRITIDGSAEADSAITREHVAAAKAEAARFATELVDARAQAAGVNAALAAKSKDHDDAQVRVMELEQELDNARTAGTAAGAMANAEADGLRARIKELEAVIAKGAEEKPAKSDAKGGKKADAGEAAKTG